MVFDVVFDCLLHDLLIAKLAAYGFDYQSLTLIQSYLSNRQQRKKVNNTYSTYSDIIFRVPQGSIRGLHLFNILLLNKLETCTNNLFKWFHEIHMKTNADKCHVLVTTNSTVSANTEGFVINNSNEEKRLGIRIDTKLSFENHVSSLSKRLAKLHAFT